MASDIPPSVHGDELPKGVLKRTLAVDCEHVEKMLHVGKRDKFVIHSDEPERMGGEDKYPAPLTYIISGIGFWLLTQLKRYASMRKLSIKSAQVHVEMDYYLTGSVLAGTVESGVTEVRSNFVVETDSSDEDILYVIRLAKRGCFAERLVQTPVPMQSTLKLNGKDATAALLEK